MVFLCCLTANPAALAIAKIKFGRAPVAGHAAPAAKAAVKPESKPVEKAPEKAVEKAAAADKPAEKVVEKTADKPLSRSNDGAKAQALLEGKAVESTASAPAAGRFVVQIGSYAEAAKAQEARAKLEKAGLKTYTQVVQPKEGKRIRVRVGPFETKAAADKVAEKIKKLDLPASILEL